MPNQFSHPWTNNEITFIKENISILTYKQMGDILHRTPSSIQSKVRYLPVFRKVKKYKVNTNFFKVWSPEMAYVLGFIAADGNVCKSGRAHTLHIACDDRDVIEKIQKILSYEGPIHHKTRTNGKISYNLRICDPTIYTDLNRLNIPERKSLIVSPPRIPESFIRDYIRGYFDGDGSVCLRNSLYPSRLTVHLYTASKKMAEFLYNTMRVISGEDYTGTIRAIPTSKLNTYYAVRLGHKASIKLFKFMYGSSTIYMERKYLKFIEGMHYGS